MMTTELTTRPARQAAEDRFRGAPPPVPFRGSAEDDLERLKNRLLHGLLARAPRAELYGPLRRAANEATSLAWASGFPLLLLPALLEEKAHAARRQVEHQRRVLRRSRPLRRMAA
jgi:hypothetical protein